MMDFVCGHLNTLNILLNIRNGEGTNSKIIKSISKGDSVTVISINNGWAAIKTFNDEYGYVSVKYLSSEKIKTKQKNNSKRDYSWIKILVSFGIVIYGIIKMRNWFLNIFGRKSSPRRNSKPSIKINIKTPQDNSEKIIMYWWFCRDCSKLLQQPKQPNNSNCKVNTIHRWYKLGSVGNKNFVCRDCGIQVFTESTPNISYCSVNSMHRWDKM